MKSILESSGYPVGTQYNPKATWNQEDKEPKEIEVTVSVTISKTVKIMMDNYKEEGYTDEDGVSCVDCSFSEYDLREAVKQQICLPEDSKDFKDWNTDDFEVIME